MTGFRVSRSGWYGLDPVDADLFTFGKVMGGGLPAAAFGGRADLMDAARPGRAGLPGRHAVGEPGRGGRRAGHAAACTDEVYAALRRRSPRCCAARRARRCSPRACRTGCSRPATCSRSSSCPTSARCATTTTPARQDIARYTAFFHAMLARGVYLPPSAFEAWFVNAALTTTRARPGRSRRCRRPPRAAAAAGRRGRRRASAGEPSDDRRPPAAARRGLQPRRDPLRPAARLPAVRRRRGDGRDGRAAGSPAATSPTWCPARWSGPSRPPRRSPRRSALPVHDRRAADRGGQRLRGQAGRRRRRRAAPTRRHWWKLRNPFRPSWGEPYVEIAARMLAAVEAARDAARGHEAVLRQPPAADLDAAACTWRDAATCTTRAGAQCGLASVTSVTYDGDRIVRHLATPSRPAPPTPTRCPGA